MQIDCMNTDVKIENLYYEYGRWVFFWGLLFSSKEEVESALKYHNAFGWRVVQFQWTIPSYKFIKMFGITLITLLTLGFVSYYIGFSIIFEREKTAKNK